MDKIQVLLQNEEYIKGLVEASGGDFEVRIKNAIIDGVTERATKLLTDKNGELIRVIEEAKRDVTTTVIGKYFKTEKDKWGYNKGFVLDPTIKSNVQKEVDKIIREEINKTIDGSIQKVRDQMYNEFKGRLSAYINSVLTNLDFEKAFREELRNVIAQKFGKDAL